jgi:hypothetical protein
MGLVLPTIAAYHVQHLPIVQAYADKMGVVEVSNQWVPSEMGIDPGTIGLGIILDTLRGYPKTFSHCCSEIKQPPCGHETQGDRRERAYAA